MTVLKKKEDMRMSRLTVLSLIVISLLGLLTVFTQPKQAVGQDDVIGGMHIDVTKLRKPPNILDISTIRKPLGRGQIGTLKQLNGQAGIKEIFVPSTSPRFNIGQIPFGPMQQLFNDEETTEHARRIVMYNRNLLLPRRTIKRRYSNPRGYKSLELYNLNTGEKITAVFWAHGKYVPNGLRKLDKFMRDWRRDETKKMDPKLYMLLYDLYAKVDGEGPINLISGFRSRRTNDGLRAQGRKTAKKSQHVEGKAADISIENVPLRVLRDTAISMRRGGVGYYPQNNFIHVDTGDVRSW